MRDQGTGPLSLRVLTLRCRGPPHSGSHFTVGPIRTFVPLPLPKDPLDPGSKTSGAEVDPWDYPIRISHTGTQHYTLRVDEPTVLRTRSKGDRTGGSQHDSFRGWDSETQG